MNQIERMINAIHDSLKTGYLPVIEEVSGISTLPRIMIKGKEFVNFSVNGYLGLGAHPKIIAAAVSALSEYGAAAGASRFTGGTQSIHYELEAAIAGLKDPSGKKEAVLYSAGYLANIGAVPALIAPVVPLAVATAINPEMEKSWGGAAVFWDELNHRCLIEAVMLSAAWLRGRLEVHEYNHLDVSHLEKLLSESKAERKLILTDGVFSLHGHIAPLKDIVEVADKYGAMVYVDDAHATGVLGENGRGTAEYWGVEDGVAIQMGTLSKALGGAGGFVVAEPVIAEFLRYSSGSYMFQTAMPPAIAAGLIEAIKIVMSDEGKLLRDHLWVNVDYLKGKLQSEGFNILGSQTQSCAHRRCR